MNLFPYVNLRRRSDGTIRPRFMPGPRERLIGFEPKDLRHPDGRWYTLDETAAFAAAMKSEIAAARTTGARAVMDKLPLPVQRTTRTISDLLDHYFASRHFKHGIADATRRSYETTAKAIRYQPNPDRYARPVPEIFAAAPADFVTKESVQAFCDRLIITRGQATAYLAKRLLSIAFNAAPSDWKLGNPCALVKVSPIAPRVSVWLKEEIAAVVAVSDAAGFHSIGDAIVLAVFTGQRQSDILGLIDDRSAYRGNLSLTEWLTTGEPLTLKQQKTGATVDVFSTPPLLRRLIEAEKRRQARAVVPIGDVPIVLCEPTGKAWDINNFRKRFLKFRRIAANQLPGLAGKTFSDLRDTAITWAARAGWTIPEIASMSGHTPASVYAILAHYMLLDKTLARSGNKKMLAWLEQEGISL